MTKGRQLAFARDIAWLRICEAHFISLGLYKAAGEARDQRMTVINDWSRRALRF